MVKKLNVKNWQDTSKIARACKTGKEINTLSIHYLYRTLIHKIYKKSHLSFSIS